VARRATALKVERWKTAKQKVGLALAVYSVKVEWRHARRFSLLHCFSLWSASRALKQSTNFGADCFCDQRRFLS
jgi:hypothetical protein